MYSSGTVKLLLHRLQAGYTKGAVCLVCEQNIWKLMLRL